MRPLFRWLSPGGAAGRLSVLIFHRVLAAPDPLFPAEMDAARFTATCDWLRRWLNVLPLDDAARRLRNGTLPPRAASITFDDGYADNHDVALPILLRHGLPATFFVATGFMGGGCMWNDIVIEAIRGHSGDHLTLEDALPGRHRVSSASERRQLIDRLLPAIKHLAPAARLAAARRVAKACGAWKAPALMMQPAQVQALRQAGMQIGAHTVHHPILAVLDDDDARTEIGQSKRDLEQLLDEPVTLFAYPNGRPGTDYSPRSVELVREAGFELAVSTAWGAARYESDPFQMPRFTPWDRTRARFGLRLVGNLLR